jgi:SAM-dependent methyltransferase
MREDISEIVAAYAEALARKGATLAGVGWPRAADVALSYETLLDPIDFRQFSPERPLRLLDLGCGPGFLLDYLAENNILDRVDYTGADITQIALEHAHRRWPAQRFELRDVRDRPFPADTFDYCILCGVFIHRHPLSLANMKAHAEATLTAVWPSLTKGIGFNVMSKHVDWERDDLFHWPLDEMMAFCKANLSRHVTFRLDYGLWEASALVLREPVQRRTKLPAIWLTEESSAANQHR